MIADRQVRVPPVALFVVVALLMWAVAAWLPAWRVAFAGRTVVADLSMDFLHDGLPRRRLTAVHAEPAPPKSQPTLPDDPGAILLRLLSHPNVASKEAIIRRYDHEVRGGTVVRPLGGPQLDGPNDAAVLKPLHTWEHDRAFALSNGINPLIGRHPPDGHGKGDLDQVAVLELREAQHPQAGVVVEVELGLGEPGRVSDARGRLGPIAAQDPGPQEAPVEAQAAKR